MNRRPETLKDKDLFAWQKRVCDIAGTIPDDRIIYWKYDSGNTGKSQLVELSKEEERRLTFKKAETRRKVDEMLNPLTRQKPSESNGSFFKDPLVP